MKFKFLASLIVQVIAFGTKCKSDSSLLFMANFQSKQDTLQPNTRVAFLGDQGLGINPKAVLNMIKTWNAQAMVHLGDFDYFDDPLTFSKMHDEIFDPSFPIFGVVGNHDIVKWQEYRNFFTTRLSRSGALGNCRGDFGVNSICKWNGLNFILSGVGTMGSGILN